MNYGNVRVVCKNRWANEERIKRENRSRFLLHLVALLAILGAFGLAGWLDLLT